MLQTEGSGVGIYLEKVMGKGALGRFPSPRDERNVCSDSYIW